jgi:hypothetical protein
MKQKIYIKSVSVVIAVMVLFSSIGLTINAHYCYTTGTMKKSILPVALHCDSSDGQASCALPRAEEDANTCCSAEPIAETVHTDDCCEDYNTFIKLLSEFDLPSIKISFNLFLQFLITMLDLLLPSKTDDVAVHMLYQDPPPLVYGKQLLLAFNQLKLDPATL